MEYLKGEDVNLEAVWEQRWEEWEREAEMEKKKKEERENGSLQLDT